MINLRYHIVSITAVFLALGIGLAFGAAFIDRATVEALNRNLAEIEAQNDALEATNSALSEEVSAAERLEAALRTDGVTQLVAGELIEVPVIMIAGEGLEGEVESALQDALVAAGAQVAGVLRVTDRFGLDDDSEVADLRAVLALPQAGPRQLRTATVRQLRRILATATAPGGPGAGGSVIDPPPVPMPPLVTGLLDAGFLELDAVDGAPAGFALVPESDLRIVLVADPRADEAVLAFIESLARTLVAVDPTDPQAPPPPVVVAEPSSSPSEDDDGAAPTPQLVAALRADEAVRDRVSTVDDLDTFAGLVGVVLSTAHSGAGQFGHYGLADGASSLLPPPLVADGSGG